MKRKKNYLLFVLGNFLTSKAIHRDVAEIIDILTLLLDGKALKYIHHDNLILCHFQSYENIEDIDLYLSEHISPTIFAYFLIPKPRKMGIRLEDDLQTHLMNLNINSFSDTDNIKTDHLSDSFLHISEVLSSFKEDMLSEIKKHSPVEENIYEVDNILDKISKSGLQSLTPQEKKFLDEQKEK
jgi:predicted HicB family RNase H-like nuclease